MGKGKYSPCAFYATSRRAAGQLSTFQCPFLKASVNPLPVFDRYIWRGFRPPVPEVIEFLPLSVCKDYFGFLQFCKRVTTIILHQHNIRRSLMNSTQPTHQYEVHDFGLFVCPSVHRRMDVNLERTVVQSEELKGKCNYLCDILNRVA